MTNPEPEELVEAEIRGAKLYVGNMKQRDRKRDMWEAFHKYGPLLCIQIKASNYTGYAYVTFCKSEDADA